MCSPVGGPARSAVSRGARAEPSGAQPVGRVVRSDVSCGAPGRRPNLANRTLRRNNSRGSLAAPAVVGVTMTPWLSAWRVGAVLVATCGIHSVVAVPDAVARSNYPYCAMSRGADVGYQDCSYATFAACLEEIRGLGG